MISIRYCYTYYSLNIYSIGNCISIIIFTWVMIAKWQKVRHLVTFLYISCLYVQWETWTIFVILLFFLCCDCCNYVYWNIILCRHKLMTENVGLNFVFFFFWPISVNLFLLDFIEVLWRIEYYKKIFLSQFGKHHSKAQI